MVPKSRVFLRKVAESSPTQSGSSVLPGWAHPVGKPAWTRAVNPLYQTNLVSFLPSATCTRTHFPDYFHRIRYPDLDRRKRARPRAPISRPARKDRRTQGFVISSQGGAPRPLFADYKEPQDNLSWSPDGRKVMYSTGTY